MTSDVLLRDVTEADLPIFFEHQLDPDATEMAAFPARDRDAFMAHWARIMADDSVILKTILFGGQVAGNIVSFEESGKREVGCWIGKEYWARALLQKRWHRFWITSRRDRYMRTWRNTISALAGSWKNAGLQLWVEDKGFPKKREEEVEEFILRLE